MKSAQRVLFLPLLWANFSSRRAKVIEARHLCVKWWNVHFFARGKIGTVCRGAEVARPNDFSLTLARRVQKFAHLIQSAPIRIGLMTRRPKKGHNHTSSAPHSLIPLVYFSTRWGGKERTKSCSKLKYHQTNELTQHRRPIPSYTITCPREFMHIKWALEEARTTQLCSSTRGIVRAFQACLSSLKNGSLASKYWARGR